MKKTLFLLAISIASASFINAQTEPNENDIQFWNETKVYFKSIEKKDKNGKEQKFISPFIMGTIRVGQNVKHFVNERVGFGFDVRLTKHFKFTPSYYYIAEQKTKNKKAFEHRPRFDLTGTKKWNNASLSNRNRVEIRLKHNSKDETRYRNKTEFKYTFRNDKEQEIVTPFVSNEPFYSFQKKTWSRNEFSVGVGKKMNKNVEAKAFYLNQYNTNTDTLKTVNAFGVNLKFTID